MLVGFRYPVGLAVGSLAATAFLVLLFLKLTSPGDAAVQHDRKVERILAGSAPLVAADLAGFQERRRREGRGYARDTEALVGDWLTRFGAEHRRQMREWTRYHGVQASAGRHGFVIETSSAPAADGWYRLEVDRRARRVSATCGGSPAPGCVHGRWRIEDHGLVRAYLLGR